MINNVRYILAAISFFVIVLFSQCKYDLVSGEIISIENGKIKLGFEKGTGKLISFSDQVNSSEFISRNLVNGLPWKVNFYSASSDSESFHKIKPGKFSYLKPDPLTLILKWEKFEGMKDFSIQAKITLDKDKALSFWNIHIVGMKETQIENLVFPKIDGIKDLGNEKLAVPVWMGELIDAPRKKLSEIKNREQTFKWRYPGPLSMQCLALYNSDKCGLYTSCNDSLAYVKDFSFTLDTLNTLIYEMYNYPALYSTLKSYTPAYDAIIGLFKGDWITVAEQYREWGTKQKWCDNSRLKNDEVPPWLKSTALWVWNRGKSNNVITPAVELKQKLGLPVSILWHWWHGCSYDDGFPEYFPPREGKKSFLNAILSAQDKGVSLIVYMNQLQWGNSTESWKKENASFYAVKNIEGKMFSHVFNIFTGKSLTNMCIGTQFWKDKYSSLCDSAVNIYQTNGVYMDQACLCKMCYDRNHGHPRGGGNYWVENFGRLTSQIRSIISDKKQPILAGEGCGEAWLPFLDAMLTLQVSKERYAGISYSETIPFFQAVYHQYGITYGSYSSLVTPPYDELWPKEFAPKDTEKPLDKCFNKQFLMEQARSFVWGMQPTIANYHSFLGVQRKEEIDYLLNMTRLRQKSLKYLLYGEFCRSPKIESPEKEIKISKLSIYAGRKGNSVTTFHKNVPLLYAGTWKAKDNTLGIALASISDNAISVDFIFNVKDYDLPIKGEVYMISNKGRIFLTSYEAEKVQINFELCPKGLCILEIIPENED